MGYGNGPSNQVGGYVPPPPVAAPASAPVRYMPISREVPDADSTRLQPVDERVEQARKVQQLLAALKQPQTGAAPSTPPASGPPPPQPSYSSLPSLPHPPANSNGFYPPPPPNVQRPPFPGSLPPPPANANLYGSMPPSSTPQPGQGQSSMGSLPPNILALLQQSQTQPQGAPGLYNNMPPQHLNPSSTSNIPPNPQPNYNQLMAYLSQASTK